jgi:hypothetical protein
MDKNESHFPLSWLLGAIGSLLLLGFLVVFTNIPWEWSLFMDDTAYNTWMPKVEDLGAAIQKEIRSYWGLGRFYPVKYIANLIKWKYLPNDPTIFRYFNFSVFLVSSSLVAITALRIATPNGKRLLPALFIFLLGSVFLHKPLLETISLNPIGETWVFLFFGLGSFFLFSENLVGRYFLSRLFFVLAAMSKEPAALVFFASSAHYAYFAWKTPGKRKIYTLQALIDLALFSFFLSLAIYVMMQAAFTRSTYFNTPWLLYGRDFMYKGARYALWTSPFVAIFLLSRHSLFDVLKNGEKKLVAAIAFFSIFGFSYLVFMSTQGRVAYQEIPASMALYALFSVLTISLFWKIETAEIIRRWGAPLLVLLCVSYFISISRWERFVRGIVEPRRAVTNLLNTGLPLTMIIPVGEISGHIQIMIQELNPRAKVFEIRENMDSIKKEFVGQVYVFEFPFYMGDLGPEKLARLQASLGPWRSIVDAKSYRIYAPEMESSTAR